MLWVLLSSPLVLGAFVPASQVAANYSLTSSTSIPFPTATLPSSDANTFAVANWGLSKGRIENEAQDLSFVADPFPNSDPPSETSGNGPSSPVLQVDYPANGFGSTESGAQFFSLFNSSTPFQSMLLSYEVAFNTGFDWVKGGKLPGIRGGPDPNGCDGGSQPNGTDCFSTRTMWRTNGEGEVYAYIPQKDSICNNPNFICNSDFGISIQRGSFSFQDSSWNRITLLVLLNSPTSVDNGYVALYYNDVLALSQGGLQIRGGNDIDANGLFFSTFFGGDDSSWAPSTDQRAYFRNFQLWAGSSPSDLKASALGHRISRNCLLCVIVLSLLVALGI